MLGSRLNSGSHLRGAASKRPLLGGPSLITRLTRTVKALLLLMVKGLRAASGGSRHVCNGSWGGLAGDFSSEGGYSALSAIRHRPDRARSPQMRERSDSDQMLQCGQAEQLPVRYWVW